MNSNTKQKSPNYRLRNERKAKGWTQAYVAEQLGADPNIVSRWESGERLPGPYYHRRLCELFEKNAAELGLIEQHELSESSQTSVSPSSPSPLDREGYSRVYSSENTLLSLERGDPCAVQKSPGILLHSHPAIDLLSNVTDIPPDQQLGIWLAIEANQLATFFDEGWSIDELLESLRVVLPGVKAMPKISRRTFGRKLLQFGAAAAVSSIPIPTGRHISVEDRVKLHNALSESIVSGWKLFHTAGNAQVLAVGQAQLFLVQQNHALLHSQVRPIYYAGVYNLIGRAQHLQEHYEEALQAHMSAHVAALGTGDPLYVAQSLVCLADTYQALGQYTEALQSIEEALHGLGHIEEEHVRVRAHLLGCWADNAMEMEDYVIAQKRLEEAAAYIEQISPKEEFDRASWLQLAGKLALMSGNYKQATDYLEEALISSPPNWLVRRASILIPLAIAYARMRERGVSLQVARQAMPIVATMNAPMVNNQFAEYLREDMLEPYPHDSEVLTFVADTQRQLPQISSLLS